MSHTQDIDIAIFGGGIAGLWLVNVLRGAGYSCVLLETDTLGGGQTLLSQGIIHGGLKYALGGALSSEAEAIAGMPDRWRQCLQGNGEPDLRDVRVLSDTQHLFSAGSMASGISSFFASRMLRGRIRKLKRPDYPGTLDHPDFRGRVYRLDDLVVETESLVEALAHPHRDLLLRFDPSRHRLRWNEQGLASIELGATTLRPHATMLAAGAGNEQLLEQAGAHITLPVESQRRPLHMVLMRHQREDLRFYAHCLGASNKPRLTITTHDLPDGSLVWYLGGDLAERGVERDEAEQIHAAKQELGDIFPWLDLAGMQFATLRVDRAEPRQKSLAKPDNAHVERHGNLLVTWPTKLTLAPDLCDRVQTLLAEQGPAPSGTQPELDASLDRAVPGTPWWYRMQESANE